MNSLSPGKHQHGAVMLVTLIFMVVMILAGLALARSVDTVNGVAGNLAFRHAATHVADIGIESAVDSLEQSVVSGSTLGGYYPCIGTSSSCNYPDKPMAGQSWDTYWMNVLSKQITPVTVTYTTGGANPPVIQYVIQRLCEDPSGVVCAMPPYVKGSMSGDLGLLSTGQRYYRITCRVQGPGTTVTYVQAIVLI